MSIDDAYPKRQPPFPPPSGAPFGMVRRNSFGRNAIQSGLLPMNLLRSHLYPGNKALVQEGLEDFAANIERGEPIPHLPQAMAFTWNHMQTDGTPTDPGGGRKPVAASAASLAAAVAYAGQFARMTAETVVLPENEDEAKAMVATLRILSPAEVVPQVTQPAREVNGTGVVGAFPTQQSMLDAYGNAVAQVERNAVERRGTYLARAMKEIGATAQKTLSFLRPR